MIINKIKIPIKNMNWTKINFIKLNKNKQMNINQNKINTLIKIFNYIPTTILHKGNIGIVGIEIVIEIFKR